MLRLVSRDYTASEYEAHLGRLLGFYEPLEAALDAAVRGGAWPPIPNRSALLARDLEDLGVAKARVGALPRCVALPAISAAALPGCLYVYEGASLGGQVVGRHLQRSLGGSHAFAFYHSDASERRRRWTTFCRALAEHPAASLEVAGAAAVALFGALADWLA